MYSHSSLSATLCALQLLTTISSSPISRGFLVAAQADAPELAANTTATNDVADFNQTVKILGQMQRTDQDFKDGLAIDLFSPTPRTLTVRKNTAPLPPQFVTGSSGEPFIALSNYSYVIKMNETARDLVAKIELPYDTAKVKAMGVDPANTYVGKLSADGLSWHVSETQRNVHVSENNTRIIKMTELDGEYVLLGRKTVDTGNIFVQYGQGATRTVNMTGGKGTQEAQFVDGLRISAISDQPMKLNVDLKAGVAGVKMPTGMRSLNSYAWVMNTSMPNQNLKNGSISFPINKNLMPAGAKLDTMRLTVGKRAVNGTTATAFEALRETGGMTTRLVSGTEPAVRVSGMTRLDGEYVILMTGAIRKESEKGSAQKDTMGGMKSSARRNTGKTIGGGLSVALGLMLAVLIW